MTEEQSLYVSFKNRQRNSCDLASQDVAFDLEKYGPYIDKIRALFVPSLEYRIRSLLEEFVYSTDSRSAGRFPRFKRLVDVMATWKGLLNKIAECDVGMMEEAIGNCAFKDNLITCLLDSIVLHHRLSKICRELDALGLEDNILRSWSVWNFVNERDYRANRFTHPDAAANCSTNPSVTTRHDAEKPAGREKVVAPLTTSDIYCAGSAEHMRPITPDCRARECRQDVLLDLDRGLLRQAEGNNQVHPATGSQRDDTDETREFLEKRSREAGKIRSASKLKLIVRKVYLENCGCSTLSGPVVTRLPLPCKPGDLIGRIFEADPSLTESCLIVMRRKFQVSVSNVCSCLNDVLGRLNAEASRLTIRMLHLSCEIRPGYISFKLKSDAGSRKCLFVARIPICQNVHKHTAPLDVTASFSSTKLRDETGRSECSGRHEGVDTDFNDTRIEHKRVGNTCCSQLDQNLAEGMAADRSQDRVENIEGTSSLCSINGNSPKRDYEFRICPHNKSSAKIVETMSDVTSRTGDPEKGNKEHCETADSNDCDRNMRENRKEVFGTDNCTVRNDEPARLANDTNCACLPYGNPAETNHEVENIVSDRDLDDSSQSADLDRRDWTSLSNKELDSGSIVCSCANTSSITSFVQDPERDKQLVELNCNRFLNNNVAKVDERPSTVDVDLLNSSRAEVGCESNCSCRYDDFINITVIGDVSEGNVRLATYRDQSEATKPRDVIRTTKISSSNSRGNNTISVQTPRLQVSSKGISVDISFPHTAARLASDRSISSDKCNGPTDLPAQSLAVPRKEDVISHNGSEEVLNMVGRTRGFIRPPRRRTVSKRRLRSNANPRQLGVWTEEDPRDHSTSLASNTSPTCRSFATDETKKDRFQNSRGLRKLRLRYVRAASSNGVRSVTSVTTIKYRTTSRKRQDGYPTDARQEVAFATSRFRRSVDKSIHWMKRLVRTKLAFFNHERAKTASTSRTFWESDECAGDVERRTAGTYIRQGCYVTPCSNPDCRGPGCTISHVESLDVTPPCRRNWGEERSEGGMKLRDRRLAGGSEVLSSFRSIVSPWSYDLLTPAPEDFEAWELVGGSRRRLGRDETESERDFANRKKNFRGRDYGNYEESITISLQSAAMSLANGDSAEHLERSRREQRKKPRDGKSRGRDRRASEETQARRRGDQWRRKPCEIRKANDEFSELSFARIEGARDKARKRSHGVSKSRNARRPSSLGETRETTRAGATIDRLRKRRVFALLADTCHDCARDLDLEFESALSRYVDLCRNVKRSLMRTLWPNDVHGISAPSTHGSDW